MLDAHEHPRSRTASFAIQTPLLVSASCNA